MLQLPLRQVIARRNWFGSSSAIHGSSNVPPFVPLPPTIRMACMTPYIAFIAQFAKHSLLYGTSVHGTTPPPCPDQALFWTHTLFLQWHFFYFGCIRPSPPLPPTPSLAILKILSLLDFRHGRPYPLHHEMGPINPPCHWRCYSWTPAPEHIW